MTLNFCYFLSQRLGLLIWTYIKLISPLFLSIYMILTQQEFIRNYETFVEVAGFVLLVDATFNILCVIGCHMKNIALLRVSNIYYIGQLIIFLVVMLTFLRVPSYFPIFLCSCISQVYGICLTQNVISEIKYEFRKKNVRIIFAQPKGKFADTVEKKETANELMFWCDEENTSTISFV